jgi:hypothetical protein
VRPSRTSQDDEPAFGQAKAVEVAAQLHDAGDHDGLEAVVVAYALEVEAEPVRVEGDRDRGERRGGRR